MSWKRHTLLDISDTGREAILAELAGCGADRAMIEEKIGRVLLPKMAGARIPGIVRREESAPRHGSVPVGFCGPRFGSEGRLRLAAFTSPEHVVRKTSPYDLMSLPIPRRTASTRALSAAKAQAEAHGLVLGVWGSAALELYTGLPYTHEASDLDLLVAADSRETLSRFLIEAQAMEKHFALRIDIEVELPKGYGVQLKELFGPGRTIIGKSLERVELLPREKIWADLPPHSLSLVSRLVSPSDNSEAFWSLARRGDGGLACAKPRRRNTASGQKDQN